MTHATTCFFPRFQLSLHGIVCAALIMLHASSCESPLQPVPQHAPAIRGISYPSFGRSDFSLGSTSRALDEAKQQTAADVVAINVFLYQDSVRSTTIYPTFQSSDDNDVRTAIHDARRLGMSVFLKVNIDVLTGPWRGYILPDSSGLWFASYTATLLHYAQLAQTLNVELFSVGCELIAATQPRFSTSWRALIQSIRSVYTGQLTYCSNWNGIDALNLHAPEFEQIEFWGDLDIIGVDVYQPLASSPTEYPTLAEATNRLSPLRSAIYRTAQRWNRPVAITESGLQSVRGALAAPYDFSLGRQPGAIADEASQNLFVSAMISAFGTQSWCLGIYWWNWESVESTNASRNYSLRNKLASRTIRDWYNLRS